MATQDVNGIPSPPGGASALGSVARNAVLWSGGSNLLRDLLQFATMLALVRLLTPEDYGRAALAQTALILISVLSFKTFIPHALQLRDPATIDWQSHFTAAIALNVFAFALTLVVAGAFSLTERYAKAALPLAVLFLSRTRCTGPFPAQPFGEAPISGCRSTDKAGLWHPATNRLARLTGAHSCFDNFDT